jgi:hypothetical protein
MPLRTELALVVVEYPDGRVAVQAVQGNAEAIKLYNECNKADADVRMSLVCIELDGCEIKTTGLSKMVKK